MLNNQTPVINLTCKSQEKQKAHINIVLCLSHWARVKDEIARKSVFNCGPWSYVFVTKITGGSNHES